MLKWFTSKTAFWVYSALLCLYLAIANLGRTDSVMGAISAISMFLSIWGLGFLCAYTDRTPADETAKG